MTRTGRPLRRPRLSPPAGVAGLLAVAGLALLGARVLERGAGAVAYRPDVGVARRANEAATLAGVSSITDFALSGRTLHIVDGRDAAVVRFRATEDGWVETLRLSAKGDGPGELRMPFSVAVDAGGGIAVLDGARVHTFDADGSLRATRRLDTRCRTGLGVLAFDPAGRLHLAATCAGGAGRGDTVDAVLWRLDRDEGRGAGTGVTLHELARAPRFTLDGRWGTSFSTERPLSDGADRLLFGAGLRPCFDAFGADSAAPAERCFAPESRWRADPPASLAGSAAPSGLDGPAWRWPRALPYYHDLVATAAGDVVLRIFSADSAVLRLVDRRDSGGTDLMVVPYAGLVGCRAGGCLWRERDELDGMRIVILHTDQIEALANAAARGGDGRP